LGEKQKRNEKKKKKKKKDGDGFRRGKGGRALKTPEGR
jgi:hypothetical protein